MKPLIGKPSDFLMMVSIPIQNKPIQKLKKIVINIREQANQRQIKQQFKIKKSIKKKIGQGYDYADVPYANKRKHWGEDK